jgi:AraC-like DNA-binding protein
LYHQDAMLAESAQNVDPDTLVRLFDDLEDVVFFVKDSEGRYATVNQTLVTRVGAGSREELLGRRVDDVFPGQLGRSFRRQDERVMESGRALEDRLELHLYPGGHAGWCRTRKIPLQRSGSVCGLVGFSRDLHLRAGERAPEGVARAIAFIDAHLDQRLTIPVLARVAGMAARSFERAVYSISGVSAGDLVIKARIDAACRMLEESDLPVGRVAQECGYADHSAFTRQFRTRVGVTPRGFRAARG